MYCQDEYNEGWPWCCNGQFTNSDRSCCDPSTDDPTDGFEVPERWNQILHTASAIIEVNGNASKLATSTSLSKSSGMYWSVALQDLLN